MLPNTGRLITTAEIESMIDLPQRLSLTAVGKVQNPRRRGDNRGMQLETRYARQAGAHIAFQVCGRGGVDLLFIPGLISHLDLEWEDTAYRSFVLRLSRMARVIRYDKRGNGLSDPVDSVPSMEQRCAGGRR